MKSKNNPSAIAQSRQRLPYISEHKSGENVCAKGAYVLKGDANGTKVTLIASGSEVEIALEAFDKLKKININSKVVSVPCFDIFEKQSDNYKKEILGENTFKVSIEASSKSGWKNIVGKNGVTLGMTTFGKSGPYKEVYKLFNLTSDEVVKIVSKNV